MSTGRLLHMCAAMALACSFSTTVSAQSSSSSKHTKASPTTGIAAVDDGAVSNGFYRNKVLGLACKIPAGWVLRTDEMNAADDENAGQKTSSQGPERGAGGQRVLLAAFSRPPDARGEDINSSILIAAEPVSIYPGLKEAAQYFGPLTEVAKAQGFSVDEEPYEYAVGAKKLVRADFHKDVGTRVMRQSSLAFLSHGQAVSITIIGGTEDEVEELIDGISFASKP
ncbi:MAG TPA: hypothetical protein VF123_04730 [Candidatus Sulfotelmatobacter sp.]